MNAATSIKYQQPSFMAFENEKIELESVREVKPKDRRINLSILFTWIAILALTVLFWYLILHLF